MNPSVGRSFGMEAGVQQSPCPALPAKRAGERPRPGARPTNHERAQKIQNAHRRNRDPI